MCNSRSPMDRNELQKCPHDVVPRSTVRYIGPWWGFMSCGAGLCFRCSPQLGSRKAANVQSSDLTFASSRPLLVSHFYRDRPPPSSTLLNFLCRPTKWKAFLSDAVHQPSLRSIAMAADKASSELAEQICRLSYRFCAGNIQMKDAAQQERKGWVLSYEMVGMGVERAVPTRCPLSWNR